MIESMSRKLVQAATPLVRLGARRCQVVPKAYFAKHRSIAPTTTQEFPLSALFSSRNPFDLLRAFENSDPFQSSLGVGSMGKFTAMPMDIRETSDAYEIKADLPGVKKEDIRLSMKDNALTIAADREHVKKEDGVDYHRMERQYGHATRSVILPDDVDHDNIEAHFEDGVLNVRVSKVPKESQEQAAKNIEIK